MSEYISRNEARDDLNELVELYENAQEYGAASAVRTAVRHIARFPAADVAPIVRCKNCKLYTRGEFHTIGFGHCEKFDTGVHDDFYCKTGEHNMQEADHA